MENKQKTEQIASEQLINQDLNTHNQNLQALNQSCPQKISTINTLSQNQKWQKIIDENQKQDEQVPFLLQQKSFQSNHQNQDYQRQKALMQQTAKNGRQFLIAKNYQQASKQLSKTLMAFQFIAKNYAQTIPKQTLKQLMIDTVLPAHNNLALCYLKLKNYQLVVSLTNQVIGQDPSNVKARYRRGIASMELKNTDQAIKDFQFVKKLDPEMQNDCNQKIIECRKIETQQRRKRKLAAQKFLSGYQSQNPKIINNVQESKKPFIEKKQNLEEPGIQKEKEKQKALEKKQGILEWIKKKCQQCTNIFSKKKNHEQKQQ